MTEQTETTTSTEDVTADRRGGNLDFFRVCQGGATRGKALMPVES
jgi:hypothetical protein